MDSASRLGGTASHMAMLFLITLAGCGGPQPRPPLAAGPAADDGAPAAPAAAAPASPWRARGRLVCLAEAMQRLHKADVPPVHEHLWGFAVDGALAAGEPRYVAILRTSQSEALFADRRFQERVLILSGRRFPESALVELSGWLWERDGKLWRPYYWCGVCSIRGVNPGDCACCQAPVELREEEAREERRG